MQTIAIKIRMKEVVANERRIFLEHVLWPACVGRVPFYFAFVKVLSLGEDKYFFCLFGPCTEIRTVLLEGQSSNEVHGDCLHVLFECVVCRSRANNGLTFPHTRV